MDDRTMDDRSCRWRQVACGLAGGALLSAAVGAHDTWLLPDHLAVAPGAIASLSLTSGMSFPAAETAIAAERLAGSGVRLAGRTRPFDPPRPGEKALALTTRLAEVGVATLWAELHPRTLELDAAEVEEYLPEIGAGPAVRQRWEASPGRRWRETYRKHAKTFVRVGEPRGDRSWGEPVGMAFELVPEQDPTSLRAGDELTVRLLRGGAPLADQAVGLVREGSASGELARTGADGRVSFHPGPPGRWLLRATDLRPAHGSDLDWESDFTTLTFEVR